MSQKKTTVTAAALAAAGALVAGGAAIANAATPIPTPQAGSGYGAPGYGAPGGQTGQDGQRGPGGGQHTAASAAETTQVKAAVKAKDSSITVQEVRKDADGSFDALGTKSGQRVMVNVSADYKTVTVDTGFGGRGGHGHGMGTAATAAQTTQVKAAVKAKDSAVTVEDVRVDSDGSFHARGTKAGQPVMVHVSEDLKTVTVDTRGPGGHGGHGRGGNDTAATAVQTTQVKAAVKAKVSAITVTDVKVDPDGSYDAFGTKAGQPVMVEVSKDLKTVTVRTGGPQGGPGGQQGQQGQAPQSPTNVPSATGAGYAA